MSDKVRVLVVDDSAFARVSITKALSSDPEIEVIAAAHDGIDALDKIKSLKPDVVTLDVSMPRMDGLTALKHIMSECPTPVVMLSAHTGEGTHATIEALQMGAIDFHLKVSGVGSAGLNGTATELLEKIKIAAKVPASRLRMVTIAATPRKPAEKNKKSSAVRNKVVVIGSSTGGPKALTEIVPALPADIPAAILIVQHMPGGFTKSLSERLDMASQISVKEAEEGDELETGKALLAPGGFHMVLGRRGRIHLNEDPPQNGVRPAVDVTMESVAKNYGKSAVGIVLTGMGSDGTRGAKLIKGAGGTVSVEHESTCAVYGMPRSVVEANCADSILKLPAIADEIARICREG